MIVWIPNGIGTLLCIFELYICWHYPSKKLAIYDESESDPEEYSSSDYAVYSSSKHMTGYDIIPLLGAFVAISEKIVDPPVAATELTDDSKIRFLKTSLATIPEDKGRVRAATTTDLGGGHKFSATVRGFNPFYGSSKI
jgi:hypothetical protein